MNKIKLGFAMCGSFCTRAKALAAAQELADCGRYEMTPLMSEIAYATDTRFGRAEELRARLSGICGGREPIHTVREAEPIGPQRLFDILAVVPCTGNTLAKLAQGLSDSAVSMAMKAQLRNSRPVVLAISSNDALAAGARNLAECLPRRNIYFVPFGQDDAFGKPTSLAADLRLLPAALESALEGRQLQPLLL